MTPIMESYLSVALFLAFTLVAILVISIVGWFVYRRYNRVQNKNEVLPMVNFSSGLPRLDRVCLGSETISNKGKEKAPILELFEHSMAKSHQPIQQETIIPNGNPDVKDVVFEREIGKGKFGKVWRGTWVRGGNSLRIALRELAPKNNLKGSEKWMHLKPHRNVVQMYGVLQLPNGPKYVVSEFVASGSLWDLLTLGPPLADKQALQIIHVVAQGLEHLHSHNIAHGDLSSKNVLLKHTNQGWEPKLTDYATTPIWASDDIDHMKIMPPEWFLKKDYNLSTDMWSFACLAIQVFTCEELYANKSLKEIVTDIPSGGLRPHIPANCPKQLVPLIETCLSHSPNFRPFISRIVTQIQSIDI